jgi:hypothetical protein
MTEHVEESVIQSIEVPYPSSWIDRLIERIGHLPGPVWLFYVLSVTALTFLAVSIFWIDGSVQIGSIDPVQTASVIFVVYWLALYHYLTRVGSRSLRIFRPLLESDDSEIARIDYELATLPRMLGWVTIPLGFAFTALVVLGDPTPYGDISPRTALPYVADVLISGFMVCTFFCLLIRSVRQLRMVRRLHARATNINLLKLEPTHAFSALTARTGIGLILVLIFAYILDPTATIGSTFDILAFAAILLLAIAIFVLPVLGIREQLEAEKQRVLDEASDRLHIATDSLHRKVDLRDYDGLGGTETAISALIRERELFEGISTWPWDPRTIRGFASTLLLPIFIWLTTRLLERFL